jgi:hypothetical protein
LRVERGRGIGNRGKGIGEKGLKVYEVKRVCGNNCELWVVFLTT